MISTISTRLTPVFSIVSVVSLISLAPTSLTSFFAQAQPATVSTTPIVRPQRLEIRPTPEQLQFEFGSQDGEFTVPCTHRLENSLTQDWEVKCGNRTYTVHLWLRAYPKDTSPRLSYEVLHWVTDRNVKAGQPGQFFGSTIWFRLEDPSAMTSLDLSNDTENVMVLRTRIRLR